jgi:FlaA1/EpsC-like NDP-sugar epimerase
LGSRGSVVPLFTEQLRKGGPVLVTHPEVTRYFMTIPEAARLVLQAQAMSVGGEIFVLDMGEPVRIVDLARKMIALSNSNAKIEFTTLRPGEKLHEVLVHGWSSLVATDCEKVSRVGAVHPVDPEFADRAKALVDLAHRRETAAILDLIGEMLPDFAHDGRRRAVLPEDDERTRG